MTDMAAPLAWVDHESSPASDRCRASLTFDDAQAILFAHAKPLDRLTVPIGLAGSMTLAEPVVARLDSPRADVAAMDGYAVRSSDIEAGCTTLRVTGTHFAGASLAGSLGAGAAVRIMTGAPMPAGADRVIMLEDVVATDAEIRFAGANGKRHVRPRASDFAAGDVLLEAGTLITPRTMLVAAAADMASLSVWRRPRVALIASGDEIVAPGDAQESEAAIPDSLTASISLLVREWGGDPVDAVRVRDKPEALSDAVTQRLVASDVIVMVGGASHGDRDHARAVLTALGLEMAFCDVAMKPGKPVWYGRVGARHVLGLPGNPTAALTIARLFLAPLLAGLGGRGTAAALRPRLMPLAAPVEPSAREQFLCGVMNEERVRIIERQAASGQAYLRSADCLVRLPAGAGHLQGDPVATFDF